MKKYKFKIKCLLILFLFSILINPTNISNATNDVEEISNSEYSYEYEKWLDLSEDEKENSIMPPIYTIDIEDSDSVCYSNFDITASNNATVELPTKYNINDTINITVRNQGDTNSCWAISATEMFETNNAKVKNLSDAVTYSSRHLDYSTSKYFSNNIENVNGFNRKVGEGANYNVAMAYFTSGKGPILEADMEFENNVDLIDISEIQNKTVQSQILDYTEYPNIYKSYDENNNVSYSNGNNLTYTEEQISNFRDVIKEQIMQYGAVGSYTYAPKSTSDYNYFSNDNGIFYGDSYFCNNPELTLNHAICIVGWDDTYSRENFKEGCRPANDGAYIVLNSWGTNWNNNNGYYYISYDDYFIELYMYGIQNISDKNYDNIYQYDELGKNYALNSNVDKSCIYGANLFYKNSNIEKLTNVGLYIYNNNSSVEIYLSENVNELNISNLKCIGQSSNLTVGYHVININEDIYLNNDFAIIIKVSNEDKAQLSIEANYSTLGYSDIKTRYNTATSNPYESYYSVDGISWNDLYEFKPDANICIKAFTINVSQSASDTDYIKNTNWNLVERDNTNILSGINENTTINELLSTNNFYSKYTVKAYKNNIEVTTGKVTTGTVIKIFENDTELEEYSIVIYGDTTGDGSIASVDALTIVKNKLGLENFKNVVYEEAGRVTTSTRASKSMPSAVDALACVKYKLGTGTISQY